MPQTRQIADFKKYSLRSMFPNHPDASRDVMQVSHFYNNSCHLPPPWQILHMSMYIVSI